MTINEAITRSSSHTEIVHLTAPSKAAAMDMITEAEMIAIDADLESGWNDTNEGYEVFAGPANSDKMEWRIAIKVTKEEAE